MDLKNSCAERRGLSRVVQRPIASNKQGGSPLIPRLPTSVEDLQVLNPHVMLPY